VNVDLPAVTVIVVAYNARAFISCCLDALLAQDYERYEVIVVDNASADGTADYVRRVYPTVSVIASPRNVGYGMGNNLGAASACGAILAFLNPDAVPASDWLRQLVGSMCDRQCQLATSMILLRSDPTLLNSGGNLIHYLGLSYCRGLNAPRQAYTRTELVSGASGAACAITRALFERIGGFDETFFLYHDDVDLSLRSLLAGEPCLYVANAVVVHDYEMSVPPEKWGWIEAHRYAVLFKTFDVRTLLVLSPALIALDLLTFAYLATRGGSFVVAKLHSYRWLSSHVKSIMTARRRAQQTRVVPDRQLIARLADWIPYEQQTSGAAARLASKTVDRFFGGYRRLSLAVIGW
jgi:GT2 family glycosyltransferase